MKTFAIILISIWISVQTVAQVAPQKYFVEFMDKYNSPYSVTRPQEFLTSRAIERRQKQGIVIAENDIPVNQTYITALRRFNVGFFTESRWFNGVTIYCLNPAIIDSIRLLPFVKHVVKDVNIIKLKSYIPANKYVLEEVLHEYGTPVAVPAQSCYNGNQSYNYGPSYKQIHMLRGDSLHKMGYRGQGKVIAILDAGFNHADTLRAFDSLWANNQILGTRDFVHPGNNVYKEYEHGMEVLSCMGANLPGELIGTAPKAAYWLLRSEDYYTENLIEEYNWVAAAEFADSVGADIINSSLGYTEFDDPTVNHTCADMNGNTTPSAKGANLACSKGMVVVNSAGNEGGSAWHCVSTPSDAFGALAIAAVDSNGIRAGFSSTGEATGRIKPNVAAMGSAVIVSSTIGLIMHSSGTSFSSPIIAGMAACLWQAAPDWSCNDISRAIEISSSKSMHPDSLLGYGIPDFVRALKAVRVPEYETQKQVVVYPNPFTDVFSVEVNVPAEQEIDLVLYDQLGRIVRYIRSNRAGAGTGKISFPGMAAMKNGNYMLKVAGRDFVSNLSVVKMATK